MWEAQVHVKLAAWCWVLPSARPPTPPLPPMGAPATAWTVQCAPAFTHGSPWTVRSIHPDCITLVLWSIRRGEPGLGWVAVVGVRGESEVGRGEEKAERKQLHSTEPGSPSGSSTWLPTHFYGGICPHRPAPDTRNFISGSDSGIYFTGS